MAATDTPKSKKPAPKRARTARRTSAKAAGKPEQASATQAAGTATTSSTRPSTPVARAQQLAQRAVLIQVGAAFEARDRVASTFEELVGPYRSLSALEQRLERLEQRGGSVRAAIQERIENVVQNGVDAGRRLVNGAQGRIARAI